MLRCSIRQVASFLAISLAGQMVVAQSTIVPLDRVVVHSEPWSRLFAPFSLFNLSADLNADTSLAGFAQRVPNLFVSSSGAHSFNDTFALRGLANTPIFGSPSDLTPNF